MIKGKYKVKWDLKTKAEIKKAKTTELYAGGNIMLVKDI